MSVDPVIQSPGNSQSINPYSYIMNNPLAGTDPTGYAAVAEEKVEITGSRLKRDASSISTSGNKITTGAGNLSFSGSATFSKGSGASNSQGAKVNTVSKTTDIKPSSENEVGISGNNPGEHIGQNFTVGELILEVVDPTTTAATGSYSGVNSDGFMSYTVTANPSAGLTAGEKAIVLGVMLKAGSKAANAMFNHIMKGKMVNTRNALPAPRQIEATWGGSSKYKHGGEMTAIQHVMYRHGPNSGFPTTSKFSKGTSLSDVTNYVDSALRYGKVSPNRGTGYTVQYDLGRTIGTNKAGNPTSIIKANIRDGVIKTAFPL